MIQRDWTNWRATKTPLDELWDQNGPLKAQRIGRRTSGQIRQLLRESGLDFVVADVGLPLQWHTGEEALRFWATAKNQICDHLEQGCELESFPDEYFFFAEEWRAESGEIIILLIRNH